MQNGLEKRDQNSSQEPPLGWGETMRNIGFVLLAVLLSWLMSGVFVLKENQYAMVSKLGQFHSVRGTGVHWVMPFPFAQYEIVSFTEKGNVTVGDIHAPAGSGLAKNALLSADGKPFEMQVQLQYRIPDIKHYLTTQAVEVEPFLRHAAAAVMRQFASKYTWQNLRTMPPEQLAKHLQTALQQQLDNLSMGIVISKVVSNAQSVAPVEAVKKEYASLQAIEQQFTQDKLALQASNSLAQAKAKAVELREAAKIYKATTLAQAQENTARFAAVLPQYQKNPQAARAQLHHSAMQTIFEKTKKVIVDSSVGTPVYVTTANVGGSAPTQASAEKAVPKAISSKQQPKVVRSNADNNTVDTNDVRTRDPDMLRQRIGAQQR